MEVFLFRHGIAIDRLDPRCPADPDRALTEKGRRRTLAAARGIKSLEICPEMILTSPYQRANETADCVLEAFGFGADRVVVTDALLPEADPDEICDEVELLGVDSVLCCGHAPNLDEVIAYLLGAGRDVTALKKAGFAWLRGLRLDAGGAELVALIPPRALRSLDGSRGA